jgi:RES domain
MTPLCPAYPAGVATLSLTTGTVPAGTKFIRFHGEAFGPASFNPNTTRRGRPVDMNEPTDGARFNPFRGPSGTYVPTLYAGESEHSAALESIFHDVPHQADPEFPDSKLRDFVLSEVTNTRPLLIFHLIEPHLRQLPVPGRKESLHESELIQSSPDNYPMTRGWAQFLHASLPTLDGLSWRPRLGGEDTAYVFFGDRVAASELKELPPASVPVASGLVRTRIETIAKAAHIKIIAT